MAKRLRTDSTSGDDPAVADIVKSRAESVEAGVHTTKYASLEPAMPGGGQQRMRCMLPPHKPLTFSTYDEYETHYQQSHTNRCVDCSKNFPSTHFLELHIAENHDPINASKREAGEKTFTCFVEGCDKVCSDWKKRRSHLVDKHGFPRNYDFLVVDRGIDGRRSMLRPGVDANGHRKSSRERGRSGSSATEATESTEATSISENAANHVRMRASEEAENSKGKGSIDDLTQSMSALKMVPRSITFGQRKGRSGFAKK